MRSAGWFCWSRILSLLAAVSFQIQELLVSRLHTHFLGHAPGQIELAGFVLDSAWESIVGDLNARCSR